MSRTLRTDPERLRLVGPSIPAEPPRSESVRLSPKAQHLAHEFKMGAVQLYGLGGAPTRRLLQDRLDRVAALHAKLDEWAAEAAKAEDFQ